MKEELDYGKDHYFSRHDVDAFNEPLPSAFSSCESEEVRAIKEIDSSFTNSKGRFDNYHLHYSSWL